MRKTSSHGWGLAWRLARREMRGGLRGFKVLLACLFLGVAAIAAAGSLSAALRGALTTDARQLLGGDLAVRLTHRAVLPAERALIDGLGTIVDQIEMRAMARAADGHMSLVELKAVAGPYPLYGSLDLAPSMTPDQALERRDGVWGAVADADLLTRLGLKVGDLVGIGDARFQLRATIRHEPDRVATVFSLGPRLMVAAEALPSTGLVQPGSLIRYTYLLRLHPGVSADAAKAVLTGAFPEAGWNLRVPSQAAPGVERFIDNMTLFLTLVGLVSLLIGGIGVANAVKGFIDGRIGTIAILKSLGAPRRLVFAVYGLQTGALALVGIAGGAALGAAVPMVVAALAGDALPLRLTGGSTPWPRSSRLRMRRSPCGWAPARTARSCAPGRRGTARSSPLPAGWRPAAPRGVSGSRANTLRTRPWATASAAACRP